MSVSQLKKDILAFVKEYRNVNFVELMVKFPDEGGDKSLIWEYENLVLWTGLSEQMQSALIELVEEKRIWMNPASEFAYLGQGGLKYLVATKFADYKKPHWLRVTIDIEPLAGI